MRPTARSLICLILALLPLVTVAAGQIEMPIGPTTNANRGESSNWLSLDELGMRRSGRSRFGDAPIRLFNGWGAVSVRDKSVTGLQKLLFPPRGSARLQLFTLISRSQDRCAHSRYRP